MPSEFSSAASVVAFYGLQFSAARIEACYYHLVDWFSSLGYHPDNLAVLGPGFNRDYHKFDSVDRRLRRVGLDEIDGVSLCRVVPGGVIQGQQWCVSAQADREYSLCSAGARCSIGPLPSERMLSVARAIVGDFAPVYGIGFCREMDLGPVLYAMGGCMGLDPFGPERALGERIDRWRTLGVEGRCYETGFLRDVYGWNFLTEPQLSRQVGSVSLRQWIEQGGNHGVLSNLEGNMWLWEVTESQMAHVRSAMERAGMVFDVEPRVVKELNGG